LEDRVECVGGMRNAYKIFVGKRTWKTTFGIGVILKWVLRDRDESVDWIHLV